MKEKLLVIAMLALITLPASAELTTADTSSADYIIDSGYSSTAAEMVDRAKARVNGVKYESQSEKEYKAMPAWKRHLIDVDAYWDPATDQDTFMNHDIKMTPSADDL